MKLAADLHIHSILSPCSDIDMTPNNIVNMCCLKELDVISITDHNSMLNSKVVMELAMEKGLLAIPGIEVTTKEEVHVLCYFKDITKGLEFSDMIYNSLPNIKNNEDVFGCQIIMDKNDTPVGKVDKLLLNSSSYTVSEVNNIVRGMGGIMVPAHIDKSSFGILSSLGFIPMDLSLKAIEIFDKKKTESLCKKYKLEGLKILKNSDAHFLKDISERDFYIYPVENTISSIINYLSITEDEQ